MSQRWRMVVWGTGLAVCLCFGRRRRGTVEEGEGVCILSLKSRDRWFGSGFSRESFVLEVKKKKTYMKTNNNKILLIYIYQKE